MEHEYLIVSAFSALAGGGNPAGVCLLDHWPDDAALGAAARAIALPVTAFIVRGAGGLELRWFSRAGTPVQSMCGHGTLAAACAVFLGAPAADAISFSTPGGRVDVRREGERFQLALPRWNSKPVPAWPELSRALGREPQQLLDAGRDLLAVYSSEAEVRQLAPDFGKLLALGRRGFIATAPGLGHDCVSRFFCPAFGLGVDEDPVTGSAHCAIAPYWAQRLGRNMLRAWQASAAGGELDCEVTDTHVIIGARAVPAGQRRVII